MRLDRIKRADIQRWVDNLQNAPRDDKKKGKLSASTIRSHHRTLRAALNYAVHMEYIGYNPALKTKLPQYQKPKPVVLAREQLKLLLEAAKGTRWYPIWFVTANIGLRAAEICGLWWDDIDWSRPAIHVRRQLGRRSGERPTISGVKSHEERIVYINDETADILDRHRAEQQMLIAKSAKWDHPEHVFVAPGGRRIYPTVPTQALRKHCVKLKLPPISMHDLRHMHGSHLIEYEGWSIAAVSERLGHYAPSFTAQVYVHVIPGSQADYIRRGSSRVAEST